MLQKSDWTLHLEYDDQKIQQNLAQSLRREELFIHTNWNTFREAEGVQIELSIHPKQLIRLKKCMISCDWSYESDKAIFCNGYQSWSASREYLPTEKIDHQGGLSRPFFGYYGDDRIKDISRDSAVKHSWTYTSIRLQQGRVLFSASLNETSCLTLFHHHTRAGRFEISLDLDQLDLDHSYPALEIFLLKGSIPEAMERWRNMCDLQFRESEHHLAYNSWYRHYNNITPELLRNDLKACAESGLGYKIFQIDDGFQQQTGDWLDMKTGFEEQLPAISSEIRKSGLVPGIWLAPFVCSKNSNIFKNHPGWLLKNQKGKAIRAGYNPKWGGWYYALDIYHTGVRDYLNLVITTLTKKWGYRFLKLDFLFAAAIAPPAGKTRGQVMHEAMELLRQLAGPEVQLLACGVPLAAAIRYSDYCRIGPDIHLKWEHRLLKMLRKRERVSTKLALESMLGRWMLNGHLLRNDPDVFLLGGNENKLTKDQRELVLQLNFLTGAIHFSSDDPANYSEEDLKLIEKHQPLKKAMIKDIELTQVGKYKVTFELNHKEKTIEITLR